MNNAVYREIYREAFGDDGEFEDRLFSLCGKYLRSAKKDGEIAAMLFALPCEIISEEKRFDAYYLYAAATRKTYRKRGYMSQLIKDLTAEGKPVFLKPASAELMPFYQKLGFKKITAVTGGETKTTAKPTGGFAALSVTEKEEKIFSFTAMGVNFPISPDNLCFSYIME